MVARKRNKLIAPKMLSKRHLLLHNILQENETKWSSWYGACAHYLDTCHQHCIINLFREYFHWDILAGFARRKQSK